MEIGRRTLLIGGGAGIGLLVAWALIPRAYPVTLNAAPGEHGFGGYLKIGEDGHVTVVVPQAELGQGAYTALAQIAADELGADWRTVGVEPAPVAPFYANRLFAAELIDDALPAPLRAAGPVIASAAEGGAPLMLTLGSTSVRAFEAPLREAGAAARALLCVAAAKRWSIDWQACDTDQGFVVRGNDRQRFGTLAAEAAMLEVPHGVELRAPGERKLAGRPLPRLDTPAKLDGSARFAADVRLPGMVFASLRQGPAGQTRLIAVDKAAAERVPGVRGVIENPGWVAAIADTWWAANKALDALAPRFETRGDLADDAGIAAALDRALAGKGKRVAGRGAIEGAPGAAVRADYAAGFAPHALIEPLTATARYGGGRLELWTAAQAPAAMRRAAARALDIAERAVTLYPMPGGGGFGRKLEIDAGVQAALIARAARRPVQLLWSRPEESAHDRMRPPARARMAATLGPSGLVTGWHAAIAAPEAMAESFARIGLDLPAGRAQAVAGAVPPYDFAAVAIDHHRAALGVASGVGRSDAHGYAAFFTESFLDELAARATIDPLSFRIQALGHQPRLAACLMKATALGGWEGGAQGSGQGIACLAAYGSFIAVLVDAHITAEQAIKVDRVAAAVDCGTIVNPDLVIQQIEGGILHGIADALGHEVGYAGGLAEPRRLGALGLPRLVDTPELRIELVRSAAPAGGISDLATPVMAPAIANAIFAASGARLRRLPLRVGGA